MTEFSANLNKYLHGLMWDSRKKTFIGLIEKSHAIVEYEWGFTNLILKVMDFNFVHADTINPYFKVDIERIYNGVTQITGEKFKMGFDDAYANIMTFFENYNRNVMVERSKRVQEAKANIKLVVDNE